MTRTPPAHAATTSTAAALILALLSGCGSTVSATLPSAPAPASSATGGSIPGTGATGGVRPETGTPARPTPPGGARPTEQPARGRFGETVSAFGVEFATAKPVAKPLDAPVDGTSTYQLFTITVKNAEGDEPFSPPKLTWEARGAGQKALTPVRSAPDLATPAPADVPLGASVTYKIGYVVPEGAAVTLTAVYAGRTTLAILTS